MESGEKIRHYLGGTGHSEKGHAEFWELFLGLKQPNKSTMKWIKILFLWSLLTACEPQQGKTPLDKKVVPKENNYSTKAQNTRYEERCQCNFERFLADQNIPQLAKAIYCNKEWNLNNDNQALALLDSLTAKNKTTRPFYFKVVTKTLEKSDGYFSEALGLAGYEFIEYHPQEFASYFDNRGCFTQDDLAAWADIVLMEFSIREEITENQLKLHEYLKSLRLSLKNGTSTQKETLRVFSAILTKKWKEFLRFYRQNNLHLPN
ncbi:MAG: hypothetical protein EBV23_04965 [Flavobacteriia bacterium]|nr:hypothetical protein [Flavobacteriia bacterium]